MELAAASMAAAKAGLGVVTPEVLHLGNHTTVKLSPWPVVARIASGTSFDFSDNSLARELLIADHLAFRDAPSVRPTRKVPPGPYLEDDCAISLWEFAEGRPVVTEDDALLAAASLAQLHLALADVEADLPTFMMKVESCETILGDPQQAPELALSDRRFLQKLYETLSGDLSRLGGAWQPLHGDPHIENALICHSGAIWMDLESVCVGPLEWDIGFLPVATWSELAGLDIALMNLLADVRSLCVSVWCWAEFDRSPASASAAAYHLGELKARFN
jgi:Ser/Thr protein kinase RdoA (MazF antagonist)